MADGEIVNPKMREAKNPLSKPVMVGVSTGCIEVVRPDNFNVKEITMQNSPTGDVVYPGGKAPSVKFDIHVTKNTAPEDDHAITGIPNATIQPITIILKEKPEDGTDLHGSSGVEDPCAYIEGKFDETPIVDCNDHSKTITASIVNSSDGNNINEGASEVSAYRNISGYTATYEPNFDNVNGNLPDTYKVCYALAVKATNSGTDGYGIKEADFDTRWTVSDIACVNIGKTPNFQVWGGSVFAEGGIKTSTTRTDYGNFGSWGDYLVIANKRIKKMASGAYYISGSASESNCDISPLTISNVSCQLGSARINSKSYSLIDGIDEYYLKNGTNKYTDIASNALDSESEVHVINLEVMNKANSKYPILIYNSDNANQDIYIKTNISLGFSEREYKDINVPQVIIFSKGNIYIDSDVTRLDAWLLTRGKIYTCATPKSAKNKNDHSARTVNGPDFCNKELVITGPLVAEKIYFDRTGNGDPSTAGDMSQAMIHSYFDTYGTDTETTIARPAEVIDYNPSIYLFGYNETSNDKQPMTTYLHKLPPRY